jgi:hypothetical protein
MHGDGGRSGRVWGLEREARGVFAAAANNQNGDEGGGDGEEGERKGKVDGPSAIDGGFGFGGETGKGEMGCVDIEGVDDGGAGPLNAERVERGDQPECGSGEEEGEGEDEGGANHENCMKQK